MRRKPKPTLKQPTPDELLGSLLAFVESKFYQGHPVTFAKDRRRILDWVLLWPAQWLNERGVTIPASRYGEIMRDILMGAAAYGNLGEVKYLPAWLAKTIQSHFAMHGDEIYDEAKNIRNLVDHALVIAGKHIQPAPDLAKELTAAKLLLTAAKGPKRGQKPPVKAQLTLL